MPQLLKITELNTGQESLVSKAEFLVGRSMDADLQVRDLLCSREQFRIIREQNRHYLVPLSGSVSTYCDGVAVSTRIPITGDMEIHAGKSRFELKIDDGGETNPTDDLCEMEPAGSEPVGRDGLYVEEDQSAQHKPEDGGQPQPPTFLRPAPLPPTIFASLDSPAAPLGMAFPIRSDVIIGRETDVGISLPHIQVSRRHAQIYRRDGGAFIRDLGSTNGTYVDGELVTSPCILQRGSLIKIGPYALTFHEDRLIPVSPVNGLHLEGRQLTKRVPNRNGTNQEKVILDDVSLVIHPREFVCLLGPSGSGKTTLLSALSARSPASAGSVLINGTSLYENYDALKSDMALVPQRDILHEALTVQDALWYTARLRLPRDTTREDIDQRIDDLLASVGLAEHRSKPIHVLSGGQKRRASLANELISNPNLIFLDEVTSGLDEQTDRELMHLFRKLADQGKTIVCVTHTLANIAETCHLVVCLCVGGKLAFIGTPDEALKEFGAERLGDVYAKLEDQNLADELQQKATASNGYQRYVIERSQDSASPTLESNRPVSIRYWQNQIGTVMYQLPLLLRRYVRIFRADVQALVGLLLQCLVVATVLFLVFGDVADETDPFSKAKLSCHILFVLSVSSFWFGCNNSVKEIVKERGIYSKELLANLHPTSYYLSKYLLQFTVASLQIVTLLTLVKWSCSLPGAAISQACVLILGGAAGIAVGLFISTLSVTEETALALVPLVLIPQIILSDIFVELTGISRWLGQLFAANYWIYGASRGLLTDKLNEQLNSPLAAPLDLHLAALFVVAQTIALGVSSVLILHIRDRAMASTNKSFRQAVLELPVLRAMFGSD